MGMRAVPLLAAACLGVHVRASEPGTPEAPCGWLGPTGLARLPTPKGFSFDVWAVDAMLKVFPTSTPPANFEPLELCLAAGESQSFQLAARPATGHRRARVAPPPTCAALNDTDFDCHGPLGNITRFPIWCNDERCLNDKHLSNEICQVLGFT